VEVWEKDEEEGEGKNNKKKMMKKYNNCRNEPNGSS
jgi:hypothetical protein